MLSELNFLSVATRVFSIISSVYNQVIKAVNYLYEMNFDTFMHQHSTDIFVKIHIILFILDIELITSEQRTTFNLIGNLTKF
jgi:hypothetical protein